ncbi:MAG: LLM class F420-dependent oxidoreductase [Actinomycetota bacterium]|nr:LLM class F420-dependent oxidoreductase [Acidimicrobiales bacterium]MDG1489248.1 LLM class F420-dependent oxidoreductase [Actinomycetota bacterium]
MKYILGLPTDHVESVEQFGTASAIKEMAIAAENLGYFGIFVTDHPAPPASFLKAGGHHTLDPMVTLAAAATVTSRLRVLTNLYIVAYRNPLLAAKAVATLDNLSEGRLILGVGAGYLKGEFAATGVTFDERGDILNQHLEVMRQAWTGEPITATGKNYYAEDIVSLPQPIQRSDSLSPPVWVGGNSKNALERVALFGEGWIPMATPKGIDKFVQTSPITNLDSLARKINVLLEMWDRHGRSGKPSIAIEPWDAGRYGAKNWDPETYLERLTQLSELGVTHVPAMLSDIGRDFTASRVKFLETVESYAQFVTL